MHLQVLEALWNYLSDGHAGPLPRILSSLDEIQPLPSSIGKISPEPLELSGRLNTYCIISRLLFSRHVLFPQRRKLTLSSFALALSLIVLGLSCHIALPHTALPVSHSSAGGYCQHG